MAKLLHKEFLPGQWVEWKRRTTDSLTFTTNRFLDWLQENWFRLLLLGILVWLLTKKDLTLQLSLENSASTPLSGIQILPAAQESSSPVLLSGEPATAAQQLAYVKEFQEIARREMRHYGIPASIKLAQAILETNAGTSALALRNNNHFGIKCFSKTCGKGHCSNFSDDSHKDFFRIYPTARDSYRSHSQFLQGDRYRELFKLKSTDYRGWAQGLAAAGYATDKRYAEKLIQLIEGLELHKYDS